MSLLLRISASLAIVGSLAMAGPLMAQPGDSQARWVPVDWSELPGWQDDALYDAWAAWLRGCERSVASRLPPVLAARCPEIRRLSLASADEQRAWLMSGWQAYRLESALGQSEGLLTGYFEPWIEASRQALPAYAVPLYQAPIRPAAEIRARQPWFSRQDIDTHPEAQRALRGRVIAWLADPIDALILQIQGSGRLRITEPDGRQRLLRLAFAGSNDHPYQSVGRWLLDQGAVRDASWGAIKEWARQNPQRLNEMLWSNPRYVFFKEEALPEVDTGGGPRGAQGVPLTPGRSVAVDPRVMPYGTPVWLSSPGPSRPLHKLVLAQDTGSAIVGAVRADYYTGHGAEAADLAGRLKQPLRLWALWPRD